MKKLDDVTGPTHGDGGGADGVFEDEVPADDPGEEFAHGGVGVGVRAAGDRDHGGEFAVAHAGEGATDGGDDEREDDGGSGVIGGGDAGEREESRSDDGADSEGDEIASAEGALEVVLARVGLGDEACERLSLE